MRTVDSPMGFTLGRHAAGSQATSRTVTEHANSYNNTYHATGAFEEARRLGGAVTPVKDQGSPHAPHTFSPAPLMRPDLVRLHQKQPETRWIW